MYERYLFNSRCQKDGESIDSFVTSLRQLADTCEFENLKESLIRDRVVIGVKSKRMTQRLLRTENLTLAKAIEIVRSEDAANTQCAKMADHDKPQHAKAVRLKHAAQRKKHAPIHSVTRIQRPNQNLINMTKATNQQAKRNVTNVVVHGRTLNSAPLKVNPAIIATTKTTLLPNAA